MAPGQISTDRRLLFILRQKDLQPTKIFMHAAAHKKSGAIIAPLFLTNHSLRTF